MLVKNSKGPWELKELMELQELLPDDQLLIVKVKPSDHLYHFFLWDLLQNPSLSC